MGEVGGPEEAGEVREVVKMKALVLLQGLEVKLRSLIDQGAESFGSDVELS